MKIENIVKGKLPLTFRYMELLKINKIEQSDRKHKKIVCEKYQTDFYTKEKPEKALVRFI